MALATRLHKFERPAGIPKVTLSSQPVGRQNSQAKARPQQGRGARDSKPTGSINSSVPLSTLSTTRVHVAHQPRGTSIKINLQRPAFGGMYLQQNT